MGRAGALPVGRLGLPGRWGAPVPGRWGMVGRWLPVPGPLPAPAARRGCGLPTSSGRGVGLEGMPALVGAPGFAGAPGRETI